MSHFAIATSNPLATQAGAAVLRAGGPFIDGAIAAAAVLNVVEPFNSHLGGDAFLLVHDAKAAKTIALNGSGAAPLGLDRKLFDKGIPTRGLHAATVPGQIHTWCTAHARWGRRPLSGTEGLLARAIELAEKGSDATPELAGAVENTKDVHDQPGFTAQFRPGGQPVKAGQRMTMPLVARTLRQIADGGIDAYYRGSIAERIIADSRRLGGWFEKDDLALHHTRLLEPLRIDYGPPTDGRPGRWWICEQPPPSQGFITLQALAIAQALGLQELPFKDARRVHGLIEAVKLAFADKQRYWADPEKIRLPVAELLAPAYVAQRARAVDLNRTAKYPPGTVRMRDGDTTYLCVADAEGNAVSFIQSIFYSFGSGVVVADTGILLNNRMNGFTTEHGHVNEVAGGKRPVHTLNTYLVYEGSKLRYVGGTPGGDKQVQWNTQMLSALLDHRMTVAEAVAAPRWSIDDDGTVHIESDYGQDVIDGLRARGHRVTVVAPKKGGGAVQLIAVGDAGTKYEAACDPRCRGLAMAE